ncbi:MAG: serine/threonine protein kinase, partial [Gemmatimonadales bacterium]|nr:serine/threonine protein kinase [Gemmatimonadales bacterium]
GQGIIAGRYEMGRPIGSGGMGEVWSGHDLHLDRPVAIKLIRFPDGRPDDDLIRRFERETKITARLVHPGVPAVQDAGALDDGRRYLVMQLVKGVTVAELLKQRGVLPESWAVIIAAQVCAVLAVAHDHSLIHRDLKPANLMISADGSVKVLDFGLAAAPRSEGYSSITRTRQTLGTPDFAAPEQAYGIATPQSDLYALGCVLHQLLTGRHLFIGETAYAVVRQHEDQPPPPVRSLNPAVSPALEQLILHLLAKKPEARPRSAADVYERLLALAGDRRPGPSPADPLWRYARLVGRIRLDVSPASGDTFSQPESLTIVPIGRTELRLSRDEASRLGAAARFSSAAEVLSEIVEAATLRYGSDDADVLAIRQELADALFHGGDYRRAAAAFRAVAEELTEAHGPEDQAVLGAREQEAACHIELGEFGEALVLLRRTLGERLRTLAPDDQRVIESRRQIAEVLLGAREMGQARRELRTLMEHLRQFRGPGHPEVRELQELLDELDQDGRKGLGAPT